MKRLTLIVAAAALFGTVTMARAESGQFLAGGRLAYNWSTVTYGSSSYASSTGGHGFEVGALGRLAVVEGQMGVHIGANFLYRSPISYYSFDATEMAVGVPILFEINPFAVGGLNSSIYEMIFIQVGLQPDYVVSYSETYGGKTYSNKDDQLYERELFNIGLVIGAVGYFSSHVSFDVRYFYGLISYSKEDSYAKNWYPYTISAGFSFYL